MRAVRKVIHLTEHDQDVLSQSNANNKQGGEWCGRASASIIYNYYARLGSVPGGPIKNQSDRPPYQLLYPDGKSLVALTASGACWPGEVFERLKQHGLGHWEYVPLFPKEKRNSPLDIESIFGPLLDHLDKNNPAFFASGFSVNLKWASHFITITGYRFRGGLWLQITDPATNYDVVKRLIKSSGGTEAEAERMVEIESRGAWAAPGSTVKPFGSRYWVHQDVFFKPNTRLKGHKTFLDAGITDPLLCDNGFTPGFAVMIVKAGLATPDTYAETEHAAGWPIEVAREAKRPKTPILNWLAPIQQYTVEERGDWKGLLDRTGTFPVGTSLTWHGGVHVLARHAVGRQIYCMAPGEIVLARFPDESQGDARPRPSNGFILVRHRIDTKRRAFLDVAAESDHALELYSLYMHTGPLGAFLEPDGAPPKEVILKQAAPRWLRPLCPQPLPKPRTYLRAAAPREFCVQKDAAAADADDGGFSALPPSPTEERRVGADLDVVELGGNKITIAGAESSIVNVGRARHAALGIGPVSKDVLGTKPFKIFEPTASGRLHYFNPLTGELIKVAIDVPNGTSVIVGNESPRCVTPLIKRGGQSFVRIKYDKPAMYDHQPKMNEGDALRVCKDPVRIVLGSGVDAVKSNELAPSSHPLFFDFGDGEPRLVPVVKTTRQQLAIWQATAKKKKLVTVPAAHVQTVFNPVTDELIAVPGLGGADRTLAIGPNNSLKSMEIGGKVYVEVAGVDVAVEPSPDGSAAQQFAVFFENDVPSVELFARTSGKDEKRSFVDKSRFRIKNVDALLAFGYAASDRALTGQRYRIWLDLVPCLGVPDARVDAWNAELGKLQRSRMVELHDRVNRGLTRLMGVKFDRSGWKLDKAGDEDVIKATDWPSDKARVFCETEVQNGWIVLREVKLDKGPSPWAVAFDANGSIHPVSILKTKGVAYGAVFELLISTPYELANNNAEIDAAKASNDERASKVADAYRKGAIIAPETPVKVGREPIAEFDTDPDSFAHIEIFAEKNAIDPNAAGTDGKIERIKKTPFAVLLDQDSRDDYAPEFVATLLKQLEDGDIHLDMDALAAASAAGGIVRPAEWADFCQTNVGKLSFLVTAHASEWHPDQTKVLDEAKRRGLHLHPDEVDAQKDEIRRFAFLDQLPQTPPLTGALYHLHPFRFLEWILTGFDVTVRNAPDAVLALEVSGTTTDLTKDDAGKGKPAAEGADASTVHRIRAVVGAEIPTAEAVLVLKSGLPTSNKRLPVLLKRGNTATPTVVYPRAAVRLESDSHGDLDTAVAVAIGNVKDGFLLADGGRLPEHQFSYARVVLEVEYNWAAPTKIVAELTNASAFKLRAHDSAVKLDGDTKATLEPPQQVDDKPRFFTGAQRLTMTLDVLARDVAGAETQVAFTIQGGDFLFDPEPSRPSIKTRDKLSFGDERGEDIAKLQLYLSQIPSSDDGRPCYRWSGKDNDKQDFAYRATDTVVIDGKYKLGLARALWRFLYSYAPEWWFLRTGSRVNTVALTTKKPKKADKNAPPPQTNVSREELRTADTAKKAARIGADCIEFPVVNKTLVAEILKHMKPPYVMPKVRLSVEATTGAVRADKLRNVKILDNWKTTEIAKSAILPVNDDWIMLVVEANQMTSLGGELKVDLQVQSGGAYRFDDKATTKTITLHDGKPTAKVVLRYSGNLDSKPANNVVKAKAKVVAGVDVNVALGSIQLFGARDLCTQGKDGVAKRDAALVQALLANAHDAKDLPYYHPPSKKKEIEADGRWGDVAKKSLTSFAGSATGTVAITTLLATQPK